MIPVLFEVQALKISKMVNFMVDCGSLFSAITEKEAILMGFDCHLLPESKGEAIGFGGTFKTRMINRLVILSFKSNEEEYKIRYSSGFKVICIPPNITSEEREKILRYTPNVLGMDILTKFKIYINKHKVELIV